MKLRIFSGKNSFIYMVVVPTLMAIIYNFFIATPFYHSELKVMVKSLGSQEGVGGFASLLRNIGVLEPSSTGSYLVMDYLLSRDFMFELDKKYRLKEHYSSSKIDFIQRFDPLGIDSSYENFFINYYNGDVIRLSINPNNSVITVSYRSPDPKYAKSLADSSVYMIEDFVNRLNERSAKTKLEYFSMRVEESKEKIRKLANKIKDFILKSKVLSPEQQTGVMLQATAKLQEQLLSKQIEYMRIQSVAPDNPKLPELKKEIEAIKKEIDKNLATIAGGQDTLGPNAVELELLKGEMQILQKELEANLVSFLQAVNQVRLQQFFVELVEAPKVADAPVEPRRFRNILTVFAIAFAIWGILVVLYSGVREHLGK